MRHLAVLLVAASMLSFGSEADVARDKGFALLKEAQDNPNKIVEAAKALSAAADAYAAAGDDQNAQEMESYLYWAKKKMTINQIDAFVAKDGEQAKKVVEKLEAVEKKEVPATAAKEWLAKADAYAAKNSDQFLVAVRYFEVASRFSDAPEGKSAMEKSLAALQKVKARVPGKPAVVPPNAADKLPIQGRWVMQRMQRGVGPRRLEHSFIKEDGEYTISAIWDAHNKAVRASAVLVDDTTVAFRWNPAPQALVLRFISANEAQLTMYLNATDLNNPSGDIAWQAISVKKGK